MMTTDMQALLNQHRQDMLNWLETQFRSGALRRATENAVPAKAKTFPVPPATDAGN